MRVLKSEIVDDSSENSSSSIQLKTPTPPPTLLRRSNRRRLTPPPSIFDNGLKKSINSKTTTTPPPRLNAADAPILEPAVASRSEKNFRSLPPKSPPILEPLSANLSKNNENVVTTTTRKRKTLAEKSPPPHCPTCRCAVIHFSVTATVLTSDLPLLLPAASTSGRRKRNKTPPILEPMFTEKRTPNFWENFSCGQISVDDDDDDGNFQFLPSFTGSDDENATTSTNDSFIINQSINCDELLNVEKVKLESPFICKWNGGKCERHFPSIASISDHLKNDHVMELPEQNKRFRCTWAFCQNRAILRNKTSLFDHLKSHIESFSNKNLS